MHSKQARGGHGIKERKEERSGKEDVYRRLGRVHGWQYTTEEKGTIAEKEADFKRENEGTRKKEALLKEMTPSRFTGRLHWAAVPLCLMLSGCQRYSLAAPMGGGGVGLCSRLTLPLIRIDTGKGLSQPESISDRVQSWHTVIIT